MAVFKKKEDLTGKHEGGREFAAGKSTGVAPSAPAFSDAVPSNLVKSIVGKTLFVKGKVFSDEEVLIEGKIEGQLHIKHRVVVGKSGIVNADIDAREVIIKGTVNGNVKGSYKVEIVPDGVLNGNIVSQRVVLAEGAIFKGNIDMTLKE
jgi:cytoskeletal protein CcmA (bactofilin family)